MSTAEDLAAQRVLPDLGPAPVLPGTGALLRWLAGIVALYAALCAPVVLAAGEPAVSFAAVVAVPVGSAALSGLLHPLRVRKARRLAGAGIAVTQLPAPALAAALAGCGVTDLAVFVHSGRLLRNRAYGMGRHGFISLHALTLRMPEPARFVAAHEAGHVARRDSIRFAAGMFLAEGLLLGGLFSFRPAVLVPAVLAALVLAVGIRWAGELSCDAIAVRWVGTATAAAWAAAHADLIARARRRGIRALLRRSTAWLTHPPMSLRARFWR